MTRFPNSLADLPFEDTDSSFADEKDEIESRELSRSLVALERSWVDQQLQCAITLISSQYN